MRSFLPLLRSPRWTWRIGHRWLSTSRVSQQSGYLSPDYQCSSAWEKRLQSPILKNVNADELFHLIDNRFQKEGVISAIDVDLFANKTTDKEAIEETSELLHRLRSSVARVDQLPSSGHALLRSMLANDEIDELIRVLDDRYNYGIFPDTYTANLILDYLLRNEKYRDAAKVSGFVMLQEEFEGSKITACLSLVSCLKYLENPEKDPWTPFTYSPDITSKEEIKKRVKYLRNPYWDDHFDLDEPRHIVGKTLVLLSPCLVDDLVLSTCVRILGLSLWEKWGKLEKELEDLSGKKMTLPAGFSTSLKADITSKASELETSPEKTLPKPKIKPYPGINLHEKGDLEVCYARLSLPNPAKHFPVIQSHLSALEGASTGESNLLSMAEGRLKVVVAEEESKEIQNQITKFQEWEELREAKLQGQIERVKRSETLTRIQEVKKELKEREEVLFFFEKEEEWMMKAEKHMEAEKEKFIYPALIKMERLRQRRRGIVVKKGKISKKAKELEDETYVPPTI